MNLIQRIGKTQFADEQYYYMKVMRRDLERARLLFDLVNKREHLKNTRMKTIVQIITQCLVETAQQINEEREQRAKKQQKQSKTKLKQQQQQPQQPNGNAGTSSHSSNHKPNGIKTHVIKSPKKSSTTPTPATVTASTKQAPRETPAASSSSSVSKTIAPQQQRELKQQVKQQKKMKAKQNAEKYKKKLRNVAEDVVVVYGKGLRNRKQHN
jgi:hypothetical protein